MTVCLSIRQPFAWHVVQGRKTIENRPQLTHMKGLVGIQAGLKPHALAQPDALEAIKSGRLATGAVVGTVQLVGCHEASAECMPWCVKAGGYGPGHDPARMLDDGPIWHWQFADAREFVTPIPAKGALGFWSPLPTTAHLMTIAETVARP